MQLRHKLNDLIMALYYAESDMRAIHREVHDARRDAADYNTNPAAWRDLRKVQKDYDMIYRMITDARRRVRNYNDRYINEKIKDIEIRSDR